MVVAGARVGSHARVVDFDGRELQHLTPAHRQPFPASERMQAKPQRVRPRCDIIWNDKRVTRFKNLAWLPPIGCHTTSRWDAVLVGDNTVFADELQQEPIVFGRIIQCLPINLHWN